MFGLASFIQICSTIIVTMYAMNHPGLTEQRWMVFVTFIILTWLIAAMAIFANRFLPRLEQFGGLFVVGGFLITVIVCAVMPHVNGKRYATSDSVWSQWENATGYTSDGMAFLLGMLNGAFSVGTPDVTSHLAEEIPEYVLC